MKDLLMARGARTLLDTCVAVKPGETILIVTDMVKFAIARVIAAAALERGAETIVTVMQPRARAGQEPPKPVAEAGARIIALTEFTEEMMIHGGLEADFNELKLICQKVADTFGRGSRARITTPAGTDLTMNIAGRPGNALYCIVGPGQFSPVPNVEANVSPIEGTANGRIVVDASIPYLGIGLIEQAIHVEVRDGFITRIEGGRQAEVLRRDLESHGDKNSFNIAELGVGLNPKCKMIGIMLEDEGVLGSAHIGVGTNITLGGTIKAPCHYDLLVWHPRIEIDDKVVIDGKEIRI
ncbi:MAG: aminopeptidase [Candidatus Methylomirabilales bacterium]